MKKLIVITGSILFICIMISFYRQSYGAKAGVRYASRQTDTVREQESIIMTDQDRQSRVSAGFTVKTYGGRIAVFEGDEQEPCFVSSVHVSNLPLSDRSLLENGIAVSDRKGLDKLLQDYLS